MPQENNSQLPQHNYTDQERRSRHFGATIQLVASVERDFATATNWSAVNQAHCEKIHILSVECELTNALYREERTHRLHDHEWHEDLARNYLTLTDQIAALQQQNRELREELEVEQRNRRTIAERFRRRNW